MMTDSLLHRVQAALARHWLWRPGVRIVAAVSGGPDSLCLLHLLWRLHAAGGPALHVAHLDHGFRGGQSAAEAAFVAALARDWGLPATIEYCDIPALLRAARQNSQSLARSVRYAFLSRIARATQAAAVAVAHQADDQAETVLLHLLRGAGPAGLRGMREAVPWPEWCGADAEPGKEPGRTAEPGPLLVRPLLATSRAEIEHYCAEHHLTPCDDPSNSARRYTRSRIRHDLLPTLAAYNPQMVAALARTASVCADDYAYIQMQLDAHWPHLAEERTGAVYFRAAHWQQMPVSLQRYALRRAARLLVARDDLSYDQIEAGRAAAIQPAGYRQTLAHGLLLAVEQVGFLMIYEPLYSSAAAALSALPQLAAEEVPLVVPGHTALSAEWSAEAGCTAPAPTMPPEQQRWLVVLDAQQLDGPLLLRRRRAGDRFRPAGGPGSRRLQDFFVDQKVPRALRAAWPILATPGRIVWVAGLRADARFRPAPGTAHIVWVVLRRSAGCITTSNGC